MSIGRYVLLSFLMLTACGRDKHLFTRLSASETGVSFANTITESDSVNLIDNEYIYNGGGVAVGDINNDGLTDLYFTGNQVSGRLYLNKGNRDGEPLDGEPLRFEDITDRAGVGTTGWGTGVNMVDINADGYLDIYVCISGKIGPEQRRNKLFINNKNLTFTESARAYNLADTSQSTQSAFFDYDLDGDLDMYLLNHVLTYENPNYIRPKQTKGEHPNTDRLYRNEGIVNGKPLFRDVSAQAGITIEGYGLGLNVCDVNEDGYPDVYVCNDYLSNDFLWINNRNGTFTNRIAGAIQHQSSSAMGNDVADINNDGRPDIITLDMMPEGNYRQKMMHNPLTYDRREAETRLGYEPQYARNMLQVNMGATGNGGKENQVPRFAEIGQLAGVHKTDWSWSALFADFDNDGLKDLHITNGLPRDMTNGDFILYRMDLYSNKMVSDRDYMRQLVSKLAEYPPVKTRNYFFKNQGDLTFADQSEAWGLSEGTFSNGGVYADLDNDGDLDVVTNDLNSPAGIYRNNQREQSTKTQINYLSIKLNGTTPNTQGIGATVRVSTGGTIQTLTQNPCRGFLSSVDYVLHVGLDQARQIDSLWVRWPDGSSEVIWNIKPNQLLTLNQRQASKLVTKNIQAQWSKPETAPLFTEVSAEYGIQFTHQEENYVDFKFSPLLPQKYSQLGGSIAVGDVNGDGRDDFFVGNGYNHSGQVFVQQPTGQFRGQPLDPGTKYEEDTGSLFFDADGDGDQDLYVVSGTSEFEDSSPYQQDRLYRNDGAAPYGHGRFTRDPTALPDLRGAGSCVTAADYDHDGDLDLFVGTRMRVGQYPLPAGSHLLRNDTGKFTDVTDSVMPALRNIGLVCAALWTDVDNDGWLDLMLAGEWMPITILKNQRGKFNPSPIQLPQTTGLWNSLTGGDFDNDGDTDYVLGNLGLNNKYCVAEERPLSVYAADFDKSGTVECLLAYHQKGPDGQPRAYLSPSREVLMTAIPSVRTLFNTFDDYARANAQAVLSRLLNKPVFTASATELRSVYLENKGRGLFEKRALPLPAQYAPIYGLLANDWNQDGNLDLLLTGNQFQSDVLTGRYDALSGLCLLGDGRGNFRPEPSAGFHVPGEGKGLAWLLGGNQPLYLAAQSNDKLLTYRQTRPAATYQRAKPDDTWADVTLANGRKRRVEFYYGSGYLSQSSRTIVVDASISKVVFKR